MPYGFCKSGSWTLSESLKQRLVGAVVLIALVLILWPLVMSPGREDSFVIESAIPPRPVMPTVDIAEPLPSPPVERYSAPAAKTEQARPQQSVGTITAEPKPAPVPQAKSRPSPALDQDGLPVAWIVQVGSFGNPDNAARLKKALQSEGFKVHTKVQRTGSRTLTRVIVGPYVDKSMAERDRKTIAKKMDLAPKILRFKS
jgi:DedD protein